MFAVTGKYAFSLCKRGKKSHYYETYLAEKEVVSMELIFERTDFLCNSREDSLAEKLPETVFLHRERSDCIWKSRYPLR